MKIPRSDIKYVICFPVLNDKVLLIHRKKEPWANLWNGLGGKIEPGENPTEATYRELEEEAKITSKDITNLKYAGAVTWTVNEENKEGTQGGMYAFISELKDTIAFKEKDTREGKIAWKTLDWASDVNNKELAENLPYFLPTMLQETKPHQYHCIFTNDKLTEVKVLDLPLDLT